MEFTFMVLVAFSGRFSITFHAVYSAGKPTININGKLVFDDVDLNRGYG